MRPECSDSPHSQEDALAITVTRPKSKDSEEQSRVGLESRIAWIRGYYREREVLLEDQIERLEETYNLARAELDPQWREAQVDSADDLDDWETMSRSDYPPTEPRGKSRSPSPVFAVRVRVASS